MAQALSSISGKLAWDRFAWKKAYYIQQTEAQMAVSQVEMAAGGDS
jgi:hypothetical protein